MAHRAAGLAGRAHVQWNDLHVRLLDPGTRQLLREHLRAPRGYHRIDDRDRPARTHQILGVLALAKKHGVAVVEDAAKAALEIGVPTCRFLRKYVERRPPLPLTLRQVDPLIRQLTLYRDLIDQKTGGPE